MEWFLRSLFPAIGKDVASHFPQTEEAALLGDLWKLINTSLYLGYMLPGEGNVLEELAPP